MQARKPQLKRRVAASLVLGVISAWFVASGISLAWWAGWVSSPMPMTAAGAWRGPTHLVELTKASKLGQTKSTWFVTSLRDQTWFLQMAEEGRARFEQQAEQIRQRGFQIGLEHAKGDRLASRFPRHWLSDHLSDHDRVVFLADDFGWPMRCVSRVEVMRQYETNQPPPAQPTASISEHIGRVMLPFREPKTGAALEMPIRPLWWGLMVNSLFYATLWAMPLVAWPVLRRWRRERRGRCVVCGYDLSGQTMCPECGQPLRGV